MKQSKNKHYSIEEKKQLLAVGDFIFDRDIKKVADVCDKLPFQDLKKLAKVIVVFSKGKAR